MAKALELAVKERKNGTGKNSWRDLQVLKCKLLAKSGGMPLGLMLLNNVKVLAWYIFIFLSCHEWNFHVERVVV